MFEIHVLPELPTLLAQLAATLILFLVLRHFIYGPMKEMLQKRQNQVTKDIQDANLAKSEALVLKEDYELRLNEAKEEGNKIIEESRRRGKEVENQLVQEGKEKADIILDKARNQIDAEKQKAFNEVKSATSEMAIAIAEKLIVKNLETQDQERLIDSFIEEIGTKNV